MPYILHNNHLKLEWQWCEPCVQLCYIAADTFQVVEAVTNYMALF